MLEKLLQKLASMAVPRAPFDPAQFGDPVAMQTEWSPARGGGANFRTHRLRKADPNRLEFRAAAGAIVFFGIFLLIGLGVMFGLGGAMLASGEPPANLLIPVLFGGVFAAVGGLGIYFGTAPIVFDKHWGYFWKGRKSPQHVFDRTKLKHFAELTDIHALQIVSEHIRGNKSSYTSYELNLVLHDGRRINVVDHGNLRRLREDAAAVAAFLGVPVWDVLSPPPVVEAPEQEMEESSSE